MFYDLLIGLNEKKKSKLSDFMFLNGNISNFYSSSTSVINTDFL